MHELLQSVVCRPSVQSQAALKVLCAAARSFPQLACSARGFALVKAPRTMQETQSAHPRSPARVPAQAPRRRPPPHAQVMVNVTCRRAGCCAVAAAGGMAAAAGVADAVMGPPEPEDAFAQVTDRCARLGLPAAAALAAHRSRAR